MKIINIIAIAVMVVIVVRPAKAYEEIQQKRTVHVVTETPDVSDHLAAAHRIACKTFATADVHIQWYLGQPPRTDNEAKSIIVIRLVNSPRSYRLGVLAYALPYEGTHITVFYDRVKEISQLNPSLRPVLLAHVMTHE